MTMTEQHSLPNKPNYRTRFDQSENRRDTLIEIAKELQANQEEPLSMSAFVRATGISKARIYNEFPDRKWAELREAAGISIHPLDPNRLVYSKDDLLADFHAVATKLGDIPDKTQYNFYSEKYSKDVIHRAFQGFTNIRRPSLEWLQRHEPNSLLVHKLVAQLEPKPTVQPASSATRRTSPTIEHQRASGHVFGPVINFRGLLHAPTNELEVVFLFALVCRDLGFLIESLQSEFPDCMAKWCVNKRKEQWQPVRIEFEYLSKNYDHPTDGCDLIVCWKDDWGPACPIKVLELSSEIKKLDPKM
jgi:AcrR family transcriptional regulator